MTPFAHQSFIFVGQNRLRIVKQQPKSLENIAEFIEIQSELGGRSAAPYRLCPTRRHYRGGEHFYFKFLLQMQARGVSFFVYNFGCLTQIPSHVNRNTSAPPPAVELLAFKTLMAQRGLCCVTLTPLILKVMKRSCKKKKKKTPLNNKKKWMKVALRQSDFAAESLWSIFSGSARGPAFHWLWPCSVNTGREDVFWGSVKRESGVPAYAVQRSAGILQVKAVGGVKQHPWHLRFYASFMLLCFFFSNF